MKTSINGINLIKRFESFSAKPYQDTVGVWTIGYGHTRTVSENDLPITESQAVERLSSDLHIVETQINFSFKHLKQNQFDALSSLVFNIGWPNFKKSNLYNLILTYPESKHVSREWIEFVNAGGKYLRGLLLRRLAEITLYYS